VLNRNNLIVLLLILLWTGTWAVQTDRIDMPWPSVGPESVSIVAFVLENDAPDIDLDVEVTKATEILRQKYDVVVKIDDTPESIGSIEQGPAIVDESKKYGGKAIVLIGDTGAVLRSVAMPAKSEEMVGWVNGN
jgi:hypothetical protein